MEIDEEEDKDVEFEEVKHHLDEAWENARVNASWGSVGIDLGEVNAKLELFESKRLKDHDEEMVDDEEKSKKD